ncbi:MAG TPA: lytic transglycosylase domain-containing protein [Gaiellaceae bacterium]|nr:lytic transglycosylase domain-containing protein [Gaiellaceae bacterium]
MLPAPAAEIPRQPAALVAKLRQTERRLDAAIDRWDKRRRPPRDVTLLALYEQRAIRLLARDRALAVAVVARLPALRDDVRAHADLAALAPARPGPRPRVAKPPAPRRLLAWYRAAQRRFGVRWQLLAAVNFVESAFGKLRNDSVAGARGPMQFLPSTWRAYGLGGDVHDPRDAILGAANYLAAAGAPRNETRALYRYNPSPLYVDAVTRYARRITRDPRAFYRYYAWQVFVRTAHGVRRITGPR